MCLGYVGIQENSLLKEVAMAMKEATQPNEDNSVEKNVERLRDQVVRFEAILY